MTTNPSFSHRLGRAIDIGPQLMPRHAANSLDGQSPVRRNTLPLQNSGRRNAELSRKFASASNAINC